MTSQKRKAEVSSLEIDDRGNFKPSAIDLLTCELEKRVGYGTKLNVSVTFKQLLSKWTPVFLSEVLRRLKEFPLYPENPWDYYDRSANALRIFNETAWEILHSIFLWKNDIIPKELIALCFEYYADNEEVVIHKTLEDFEFFAESQVDYYLGRYSEWISVCEKCREIIALASHFSPLTRDYIIWFSIRQKLPWFIPMGECKLIPDVEMGCHNISTADGLIATFTEKEVSLHDNDTGRIIEKTDYIWITLVGSCKFKYGRNQEDKELDICDSIPHPDLIGQCLNFSTVTDTALTSCAMALESRTQTHRDKWLSYLFDLFIIYAAIEVWIEEPDLFYDERWLDDGWDEPSAVRAFAWNKFHAKYNFGNRIVATRNRPTSLC